MRILLVEDDFMQRGLIGGKVASEFPGYELQSMSTESEFRDAFPKIALDPPALIIMDVMLRWCDPSENMPVRPPECDDFARAGIRCCALLQTDSIGKSIPVIVLTVLDANGLGLPSGCIHVPKTSDMRRLVTAASVYLTRQPATP